MMFDFILALFSSGDKQRISTLYQVLIGKRTSSVLLYSFFENLLSVHQSMPKLKKAEFEKVLSQLEKQQLLQISGNEAIITAKGLNYLEQCRVYQVNFGRYGRTDDFAWRLLKFAVQVVANLAIHQKNYVPIETSPFYTMKIKNWLGCMNKTELSEVFYQEWHWLFQHLPTVQADFLANQLSGGSQNGLLPYQLVTNKNSFEVELIQAEAIHAVLALLETKPNDVLYSLIQEVMSQNFNQSMLITRQLILQGETKEKILQKRRLKPGTLTDHLIEWALFFADFPYRQFISSDTINQLKNIDTPIKSWRYQDFASSSELDYGEFRLYQIQQLKGEVSWND